jgi:hypothetical protein
MIKISSIEMSEMVSDLMKKGQVLMNEAKNSIVVDVNLVDNDIKLINQLSAALKDEIGITDYDVVRIHKQFLAYKKRGTIKRNYVLKDEIRILAKTCNSYSEVFNAINPLVCDM